MFLLFLGFEKASLDRRDAVAQTESNTLRLRANANVSSKLSVVIVLLFNRDIHQGIFTKDTLSQNKIQEEKVLDTITIKNVSTT
jgi:hypothetical protein